MALRDTLTRILPDTKTNHNLMLIFNSVLYGNDNQWLLIAIFKQNYKISLCRFIMQILLKLTDLDAELKICAVFSKYFAFFFKYYKFRVREK